MPKQNHKNVLKRIKSERISRSSVLSHRGASGMTLIEISISLLIIIVLVSGAMAYQYRSTHDVKLAEIRAGASRVSMMLLESWKGVGGAEDFVPVDTYGKLTITESDYGPAIPTGRNNDSLTLLGYYEIELLDSYYYVTLSWYPSSASEPKLLNATTAWRNDWSRGSLDPDDDFVRYSTFVVSY